MKFLSLSLNLSVLIFLTSCVEVRKAHEEPTHNAPAEASPLPNAEDPGTPKPAALPDLETGITWEAVPVAPDLYRIFLKFPEGMRFVNRRIEGGTPDLHVLSGVEQGQVLDDSFPGGTKIHYQFVSAHEQKELIVEVPKDLLVDGVMNASSVSRRRYARVFFANGSRLRTEGSHLTIEAESIEANGATIESFPEGARAEDGVSSNGQQGRAGGKVVLKAKRMAGRLEVLLRGEHGGNGDQGVSLPKAEPKRHGESIRLTKCEMPEIGNPGQDGREGNPGFDGGNGGDSGSILLDVEDTTNLQLSYLLLPGHGGKSGPGGSGQEGGDGGAVTVFAPITGICHLTGTYYGRKGANGHAGPMGKPGAAGSNGTCLDRKSKGPCIL